MKPISDELTFGHEHLDPLTFSPWLELEERFQCLCGDWLAEAGLEVQKHLKLMMLACPNDEEAVSPDFGLKCWNYSDPSHSVRVLNRQVELAGMSNFSSEKFFRIGLMERISLFISAANLEKKLTVNPMLEAVYKNFGSLPPTMSNLDDYMLKVKIIRPQLDLENRGYTGKI